MINKVIIINSEVREKSLWSHLSQQVMGDALLYTLTETFNQNDLTSPWFPKTTGWANKKQANFKLPPFQKFFINFLQNFSVFSILTEGDRVEK